jgi:HSP90 family molecular chaperone
MIKAEETLAREIRSSSKTKKVVNAILATDERVLARVTDGVYRQPSSALRELISNAYDADATEVVIFTDAPRFSEISIRDNGMGLSPETLGHLIKHIGGSPKHSSEGKTLGITQSDNLNLSPQGRRLIGKLGIGLFSVAQLTRHFLIITKTQGDKHRTIADITLGAISGTQQTHVQNGLQKIETGSARIWREIASEPASHGIS